MRTPTISAQAAHSVIDGSTIVWESGSCLALDRATSLVLPYLDGETPLDELIDDAADAMGLDAATVHERIQPDVERLQRAGVLSDPDDRTPLHQPSADTAVVQLISTEVDPDSGAITISERLADGTTRRTVTMQIDSARNGRELTDPVSAASMIDLLPPDSCMGHTLRAGEAAAELSVVVGNGPVRVRVDDPETESVLRSRFGDRLLETAVMTGPVQAYVVAPLEGCGPVRIYDRWGRRTGRPSSAEEAADVVGLLLRQLEVPLADHLMLVHAAIVRRGNRSLLVTNSVRGLPGIQRRLRHRGLDFIDSPRVMIGNGPEALIEAPYPAHGWDRTQLVGIVGTHDRDTVSAGATVAAELLTGIGAATSEDATAALTMMATLSETMRIGMVRSHDTGDALSVISAVLGD